MISVSMGNTSYDLNIDGLAVRKSYHTDYIDKVHHQYVWNEAQLDVTKDHR